MYIYMYPNSRINPIFLCLAFMLAHVHITDISIFY